MWFLVVPFLLLFIFLGFIRYFVYQKPSSLMDRYVFYKKSGNTAVILTLFFGSYGMLPASFILSLVIFIINCQLYFYLLLGSHYYFGQFNFIEVVIGVRVFNMIVVILFTKIRLKITENKIVNYIEGSMYDYYQKSTWDGDEHLTDVALQQRREERYEAEKERMYQALHAAKR